jgi:hypothetical protein
MDGMPMTRLILNAVFSKGMRRILLAGACLAQSHALLADEQPKPEQPAPTPAAAPAAAPQQPAADQAEIAAWGKKLDDDRYGGREAAQKWLISTGRQCLDVVSQTAAGGSLESSTRAVNVLLAWADSKDASLSEAALERIAKLPNRPIEAAAAADRLAVVRETAAVEAIKKFHGRFDYDRTFGAVPGMPQPLRVIIGSHWTGGADGLRHIAAIRGINTVSLWHAPLDDSALEPLMELSQVRKLELYGTPLSDDALAKIKLHSPQLILDVRKGGARLGIQGINCEQVLPDSPAQKAGIRQQDRIIEFDGTALDQTKTQQEQFEHLTKLISQCKPGDSKPIKVARLNPKTGATDTVELKVTFDGWDDDQRLANTPGIQDPFAIRGRGVQRAIMVGPNRVIIRGIQRGNQPIRNAR